MGQVYSVRVAGTACSAGSSAMPHLGQLPGPIWLTSGAMGQMYSTALSANFGWACGCLGFRYFSGSASNFAMHPLPQKKYIVAP